MALVSLTILAPRTGNFMEPILSPLRRRAMTSSSLSLTRRPATAAILAGLAGLVLVSAGCGTKPRVGGDLAVRATAQTTAAASAQASKPPFNGVPAGYKGRFRTSAMVLQAPGHRPKFCYVAFTSLPPQCGGPEIVGWSWDNLKDNIKVESDAGTRWVEPNVMLVGTFDGKKLTLTEPAVPDDGKTVPHPKRAVPDDGIEPPAAAPVLTTPCPEPAGGWRPADPAKATNSAFETASALAEAQSGFGEIWIDQQTVKGRANTNNPRRFIMNVGTTGDVASLDRALREVWGGSLCVSKVPRTQAQVYAVQNALDHLPGFMGSSPDMRGGRVVVGVLVATEKTQSELDDRFGRGTVLLQGVLVPID
jgi:hypothetical protein